MTEIDRQASTPYYLQLAEILQGQIQSGAFAPNDRLPSESELCRTFDLSRSTVRETLRTLQEQRVIRMVPRRGAFVAPDDENSWTLQVTSGFLEVSAEQGGHLVETRVIRAEFETLPVDACNRLRVPEGATGFALERVRSRDGVPVMHSTNYLTEEIGSQLLGKQVLHGEGSLNMTIRSLGVSIKSARRDVLAVPAPEDVAGNLECAPGDPILVVESVSVGDDDKPFDCYRSFVRSDRLRVSIEALAPKES